MDESELLVLVVSVAASLMAFSRTSVLRYHPIYFPWNPGLGFSKLCVWAGMALVAFVITFYSASDIVSNPVYIVFYLFMAYPVLKYFGQSDYLRDVHFGTHVLERRNSAAGFYLGVRTLATASIFAGCMVGEGPGFYVVLYFFLLGWAVMEISVYLLCLIRGWKIRRDILVSPDAGELTVICCWYFVIGFILQYACAGHFLGWAISTRDFFYKMIPVLALFPVAAFFAPSPPTSGVPSANSAATRSAVSMETIVVLSCAVLGLAYRYVIRFD